MSVKVMGQFQVFIRWEELVNGGDEVKTGRGFPLVGPDLAEFDMVVLMEGNDTVMEGVCLKRGWKIGG